jgi:tetratricopeptide (TPR) repeat protein
MKMSDLVQVRYLNNHNGWVDDVTLNELILSNKIKQFYRPSEEKWIDVNRDTVRARLNGYNGPERRKYAEQVKKVPRGFLSRLIKRKDIEEKKPNAADLFEKGFMFFYGQGEYLEAIKAFALSISIDPMNPRAYLNRGMAYDRIGNFQQAMDDFTKAIELSPKDAKLYYIRGLMRWRFGKEDEAVEDLKYAESLGYLLARNFFRNNRFL